MNVHLVHAPKQQNPGILSPKLSFPLGKGNQRQHLSQNPEKIFQTLFQVLAGVLSRKQAQQGPSPFLGFLPLGKPQYGQVAQVATGTGDK